MANSYFVRSRELFVHVPRRNIVYYSVIFLLQVNDPYKNRGLFKNIQGTVKFTFCLIKHRKGSFYKTNMLDLRKRERSTTFQLSKSEHVTASR